MVEFSGFCMVYSLSSKERNNDKKTHFQWFRIFLFELWGEINIFLNVNITTCHRGLKSGHINWVKKNHYAMELEFLKITFLNLNMYYLKKKITFWYIYQYLVIISMLYWLRYYHFQPGTTGVTGRIQRQDCCALVRPYRKNGFLGNQKAVSPYATHKHILLILNRITIQGLLIKAGWSRI